MTSYTGITQRRSDRSEMDGMKYYSFIETLANSPKVLKKTHGIVRLHVSGDLFYNDAPDEIYIKGVKLAHETFPQIKGYTYTHRYSDMGTYDFPANLTVNASCDTWDEVAEAKSKGWPTVTVIPMTETRKRFKQPAMLGEEMVMLDVVVCPNQTVGLTCNDCKLCMKKDRPFVVAFMAHGSAKRIVSERVS